MTIVKALNPGLNAAWIVWCISIGALPFYLVIRYTFGMRIGLSDPIPVSILQIRTGFIIFTLCFFAFMNIFRANQANRAALPVNSADNRSKIPRTTSYLVSIIICMALSESIATFGLILHFLGDHEQMVYLFVAISAIAMVIFRPNAEEFDKYSNPNT